MVPTFEDSKNSSRSGMAVTYGRSRSAAARIQRKDCRYTCFVGSSDTNRSLRLVRCVAHNSTRKKQAHLHAISRPALGLPRSTTALRRTHRLRLCRLSQAARGAMPPPAARLRLSPAHHGVAGTVFR
mmetsp:Transcript_591/g.1368  ORF Transcript_591/g.1368 Transcript_591/m.1368 type:complete len:127 (+) Transcript_591:2-382(+)